MWTTSWERCQRRLLRIRQALGPELWGVSRLSVQTSRYTEQNRLAECGTPHIVTFTLPIRHPPHSRWLRSMLAGRGALPQLGLRQNRSTPEQKHGLTAAVGWAACRLCSRAVKRLWRAVVDGGASTAVVVGWRCEGGNALVVGRHIELAAFARAMGDGDLIRWRSRLSDPRTDLPIRGWPISLTPASNHTLAPLELWAWRARPPAVSSRHG
jgi:hypothetical protein